LSAFRFAWQGVLHVLSSQRNARIHLGVAAAVIAAALGARVSGLELAVLVLCITLVIGAEMMNTVVEAIVDLVSPGYHPLAKIAKDVAAGAVLVCAGGSAIIGLIIFVPQLWHALGH
jgi:diacylglycerol kinase